jgi:hypothetical protein
MSVDRVVQALAELVARGLVPSGLTWVGGAPGPYAGLVPTEGGHVATFTEPMSTRHPEIECLGDVFAGFRVPSPYNDHVSHLVEVATVGGIECRFVRAILAQPYVGALRGAHFERDDVRMAEAPDLSWHNEGTTLCVFMPLTPLTVEEWRRTFRAWLLRNVRIVDGRFSMAGDLATLALAPQVFDVLQDATGWVVELGARDVADRDALRAHIGQWIDNASFGRLWGTYAAWRHAPLWRALCVPLRFVSRLRVRVGIHRAFAPGGAGYFAAMSEWEHHQFLSCDRDSALPLATKLKSPTAI